MNSKKVICIETGKTYNSTVEAAKDNNINQSFISDVCRGKHKAAKGLHFEYVVEEPKETEIIVSHSSVVRANGIRHNGNTNAVINLSNGDILTSCTDAAEAIGTSCAYMSKALRTKGTVKGNRVRYVKDVSEHMSEISDAIKEANEVKSDYNRLLETEAKRKILRDNIISLRTELSRIEEQRAEIYALIKNAERELIELI